MIYEMQTCPYCMENNSADSLYCVKCGKRIKLVCRNCHYPFSLSTLYSFCPKCGIKNPVVGQKKILRRQKANQIKNQIRYVFSEKKETSISGSSF